MSENMQIDFILDQDLQESQLIPQHEYEAYEKMLSLSTESYSEILKPQQHSFFTFGSGFGNSMNKFDFNLANSSKRPIQPLLGLQQKKISSMEWGIFQENKKSPIESWASTNFSASMLQNSNNDQQNILKKEEIQIKKQSKINITKFLLRLFFRNYDQQLAHMSEEEREKLGLITRRIKKIKYKSKNLNLKLMKELFGDEVGGKNAQIKSLSRRLFHRVIRRNLKQSILENNHLHTKKSTMILTKIAALKTSSSGLIIKAKGQLSLL